MSKERIDNMINKEQLNEILNKNVKEAECALVTFEEKTIPVYFVRQNYEDNIWFTQSPCEARGFDFEDTEENIKEYVSEMYQCDTDEEFKEMIDYTKSMIRDGKLYDMDCPQVLGNVIPNEIDNIKFISESECLDFMLKEIK